MFGRVASHALLQVAMWIESTETDVVSFLQDANEVATMFAMSIMESTPHIAHTIKVWDFHSGEEIITLADNSRSVSFFPDGRRLASVSRDGTLRIWDVQAGEVILGTLQVQGYILSVAISPDGTRVASGHWDGEIVLWDMSGGTKLSRFAGDRRRALSIAFSPDGSLLASGSSNGSPRIWEIDSGEAAFRIHACTNGCHLVSFTPDCKYIVSSCEKRIHEVESGSVAFVFDKFRASSCLSCGTRAVVDCRVGNGFSVLDLTNGKVVSGPFEGHTDDVWSVAITPDGRHIISGSFDGTVRIWDVAAANNESKTVWDVAIGQLAFSPVKEPRSICCVAISPDNTMIASGDKDGALDVWEMETGQLIVGPLDVFTDEAASFDVFTNEVTSLEFSSDRSRHCIGF
ncbi:WD40 repeat-like protein [Sanghuangporus baumii]|uniref:WD40 repeat-like protein n=1 Tax=Sanghuangporus baumii TaxID=108892 RepID=A0A9Q5NB04_SANBA|nr:WD40 repeat-like protein [Sanghuangporus baumii]